MIARRIFTVALYVAAVAIFVGLLLLAMDKAGHAADSGQFDGISAPVRAWFKSVKSPKGIPCCDVADGHRTEWDIRGEDFWVPVEGVWIQVPKEAVVQNAGNPFGDAVVWYTHSSLVPGGVYIRCFVPGGGV